MKQSVIRRVSILLIAVLLIVSLPCVATAANNPLISVHAYSDFNEQHYLLTLLEFDKKAYISADDALALSGYENYDEQVGKITFEYGKHEVIFKDAQKEYGETFYYPLRELMNALSTRYYYVETSDTLVFLSCSSYYENLLADCETVFSGGYELNFYKGTGWQFAGIYDIFPNRILAAMTGQWQQELYEEAIAGIIVEDDASVLSLIGQGDSIMSKLLTLLDFSKEDINSLETYIDYFGTDFEGILDAYDLLDKLIPGLSIGDAVEILTYIHATTETTNMYANAVAYGIVKNNYVSNATLNRAANKVYTYYDDDKPTYVAVIKSVLDNNFKNLFEKGEKTVVDWIKENSYTNQFLPNGTYVAIAKMIFDELGMKERSSAVMQTVACRNIQIATENQFTNSQSISSYTTLDGYAAKGERAKTVKYSTILYLRACQYAYSLYEFDDTLTSFTEYWKERTTEAISKIAAYSDEELSSIVMNDELDLNMMRCHEHIERYVFVPVTLQYKDWDGQDEYCPQIVFDQNNICSVRFNMAEYILDMDGTYQVLTDESGNAIIKVDVGTIEFFDGKAHSNSYFFLVQTDEGWAYWGESIGLTYAGQLFESVNESMIITEGTSLGKPSDLAEGVYQPAGGLGADWALDIFNIESVDGEHIVFDVEWYRTAGMADVECQLFGNIGFFYYAEYMIDDYDHEEPFYETYGMLELENDKVYLTLFETRLPYTEIGTYIYEKVISVDSLNALDDGEYQVNIYPNSVIDGKTLSFDLLSYVEISDEIISKIEIGDTLHLQDGHSFIVESMSAFDNGGDWKEIVFNDGAERCVYSKGTNSWRFAWPSDVARTYVIDSLILPLADDVVYIDRRTVINNAGKNVYGEEYNGETNSNDSIFRLNSLSDYFDFYSGEYEQATITIENGEVTQVIIYYRP